MTGFEVFVVHHPFLAYLALFLGLLIEGDGIFIMGAILVYEGLLSWNLFFLAIGGGVMIGDIIWYFIGRYIRKTKLGFLFRIQFSRYHEWLDRNFMSRYKILVFYSKFLYYVNRITPLLAGWHRMPFKIFLKWHFFAALVWIFGMTLISSTLLAIGGQPLTTWVLHHPLQTFIAFVLFFLIINLVPKKILSNRITKSS